MTTVAPAFLRRFKPAGITLVLLLFLPDGVFVFLGPFDPLRTLVEGSCVFVFSKVRGICMSINLRLALHSFNGVQVFHSQSAGVGELYKP